MKTPNRISLRDLILRTVKELTERKLKSGIMPPLADKLEIMQAVVNAIPPGDYTGCNLFGEMEHTLGELVAERAILSHPTLNSTSYEPGSALNP